MSKIVLHGNTNPQEKERAPRNRTLTLSGEEQRTLFEQLLHSPLPLGARELTDQVICGDSLAMLTELPPAFVDLLVLDPPYNLTKRFGTETFRERSATEYEEWFEDWFVKLLPVLKREATIYVCGDWKSSSAIFRVLDRHVIVRNRITWEREKGRGAQSNWKNASEDIWFATVSDDYYFNVEAVKMKRRVIAPYRENGQPKDWEDGPDGQFRVTHPSNLWTDLTVPFWSMTENTDHPTQKPEKLLAKLILASSREGDFVFDPFVGSGTTVAVARKLGRHFLGIELDENYACLALKRIELANDDSSIQGYAGGVFWERNSLNVQPKEKTSVAQEHPMLLETPASYAVTKKKPK
jgi:site-specific DNA-methyltransferase (adenine-specific)